MRGCIGPGQPKLTITINPIDAGIVDLCPAQPADGYQRGTKVILSAIANQGYKFDHWGGAAVGTENPAKIYMTCPKRAVAHFTSSVEPQPEETKLELEPGEPVTTSLEEPVLFLNIYPEVLNGGASSGEGSAEVQPPDSLLFEVEIICPHCRDKIRIRGEVS